MKPMLARTYGPKFSSFPCFVQPKLNGVRALYQHGKFQSRDEKFWNDAVVRHLGEELQTLNLGDLILDGELYVHGWKLGRINGAVAVNRKEPSEDTGRVEFHVFDTVHDHINFSHRNTQLLGGRQFVKRVLTDLAENEEDVQRLFTYYVSLGYEGIMLRPDGPYEFGERWSNRAQKYTTYRSRFLWKRKQWEDAEWICIGTTPGEGKASIGIGSMQFQHWNAKTKTVHDFSCGTGFDDAERVEFSVHSPVGKLVRLRYPYLSADGVPQCPAFVAVLQ